jgi:Zn-dependent protease with chaperone function
MGGAPRAARRLAAEGRAGRLGLAMRLVVVSAVVVLLTGAGALAARKGAGGGHHAVVGGDHQAVDESAPVEVPHPSALALRYHETGNWIWVLDEAWALAVPALLLFSGASARLQSLARRLGRSWFLTVAAYVVLYTLVVFLASLPLSYYQGFVRQHAYGMSNQSAGRWLGQLLKHLGVSLVVGVLFAWVPFLIIARSPRRWWLYLTLVSVPFAFFAMLVTPVWVDPLFNRYGPLDDPVLERAILEEARRAGIDGGRIFEVDKSTDTKALNAYVKGVLDTKRIVLYDTLIRSLDDREVLAVLGHEMGHYVLGHVPKTILVTTVALLAGLLWVDRAGRWLIARYHQRFGFHCLSEVAAVPLILLLIQVASLALGPLIYAYSRHQEHEADRFALELTRTNHSAALAFVKLQRENLGNPRPGLFYKVFRATHPSIAERIEFCNSYHPWTRGEPLVYGALFRQ